MPLINVLTEPQINEYEQPPVFTASERKHFLTMPISIKDKINSFTTTTNKIGFQLMFGYFLARKRFYFKEQFHQRDIQFLCKRLGVLSFAFTPKHYRQTTYTRHRTIILKYFAFKSYQPTIHDRKLIKAIEPQIYAWEDNERIIKFILDWLEFRQIELPTYYNLQSIITLAIRERNKKIRHRFNLLLGDFHRSALDKLVEKQTENGRDEYLITSLQSLSPSDSPKQIRANMEKFQLILNLFKAVQLLMRQMNFSDNAIRYFGEFVTASKAYNLKRRVDKYHYLACFCIYQCISPLIKQTEITDENCRKKRGYK